MKLYDFFHIKNYKNQLNENVTGRNKVACIINNNWIYSMHRSKDIDNAIKQIKKDLITEQAMAEERVNKLAIAAKILEDLTDE